MSASPRATAIPAVAERFDALAFSLIALLPLGMALLNKSAQPILASAAVAALLARALSGTLAETRDRLLALLSTPIGVMALAFLAYGALSLGWSHHLKISLSAYGEIVGALGAVLILHAALPRRIPGWVLKLAVIALAIGCLSIMTELATGLTVRHSIGLRAQTFIFKRPVAAMLMVFWPVAAWLWLSRGAALAIALGLLLALAIFAAHSSATALGLAVGLATACLAWWSRLWAIRIVAAVLIAAFAIAPFQGDIADRLVPDHAVSKLDFAHARERIQLWQSFGEVVKRRAITGTGFGTSSPVMASDPVAQEVPENRRVLLAVGHPHNGFFQIWVEMGAIGVLLAATILILAVRAIGRLERPRSVVALALLVSAAAIMTVGHGAWQGWWTTMIGAAIVWLARIPFSDPFPARAGSPGP